MKPLLQFLACLLTLIAATGHAKTYLDNGDGTVTDASTGLQWMRCSVGQTWDGGNCTGTATGHTWDQAKVLTVSFAGKNDWRLPNIRELQSLVDRTLQSPSIDTTRFPSTPSSSWSSSVYGSGSIYAWVIGFSAGKAGYVTVKSSLPVRLVRAGNPVSIFSDARLDGDYTDHADGTVTHKPTGLMWKRCAEGQAWSGSACTGTASNYNWVQANATMNTFSGKSDWRLPTLEELMTLFSYAPGPFINSKIFPSSPSSVWSASAKDSENAWWGFFSYDGVPGELITTKNANLAVRLVRTGLTQEWIDQGDGTLTNAATGLTWMRCSMGQTWTGLECSGTASSFGWDQAKALTATFAGNNDWRLPNIRELSSLIDWSVSGTSINKVGFPNLPALPNYWSSTGPATSASGPWDANFGRIDANGAVFSAGLDQFNITTDQSHARLVRGSTTALVSEARASADYTDHGDGTVTHIPTGLRWQRCSVGQVWSGSTCTGTPAGKTFQEAVASTDDTWRLPTIQELLSLIDFAKSSPMVNAAIFPETPVDKSYWTSTIEEFLSSRPDVGNDAYLRNLNMKSSGIGYQPLSLGSAGLLYVRLVKSVSGTNNSSSNPIQLQQGWTLVGNSTTSPLNVATAFGDTAKVVTVWKWDSAASKWAFYAPSLSNLATYAASKGYDVLTTINGGEGFWVNANVAFTTSLPAGTAIAASTFATTLGSGWSLISIGDNKTPREFNNSLTTTPPSAGTVAAPVLTTLWAWDATQSAWYFYAPSLDNSNGLAAYATSKSYLDFGAKTLGPGVGFWVNK